MKLPRRGPTHPAHSIEILVGTSGSNLPFVQRVSNTDHKRETISPHLKIRLFRQSMDFKDSWKLAQPALSRSALGIGKKRNSRTEDFD